MPQVDFFLFDYETGQWVPNPEFNQGNWRGLDPPVDPPPDYNPVGGTEWSDYGLMGGTGRDYWIGAVLDQMVANGAAPEDLVGFIDQWNLMGEDFQQHLIDTHSSQGGNIAALWQNAVQNFEAGNNPDGTPIDTGGGGPPDPTGQPTQEMIDDYNNLSREEFIAKHGGGWYEETKRFTFGSGGGHQIIVDPNATEPPDQGDRNYYEGFGQGIDAFMQAVDHWNSRKSTYAGSHLPRPKPEDFGFDYADLRDAEKERLAAYGYQPFWEPKDDEIKSDDGGIDPGDPGGGSGPGDDDVYRQTVGTANVAGMGTGAQARAPQTTGGQLYADAASAAAGSGSSQFTNDAVKSTEPAPQNFTDIDPSLIGQKPSSQTMFTSSPGTGLSTAFRDARKQDRVAPQKKPGWEDRPQRSRASWGGGWG